MSKPECIYDCFSPSAQAWVKSALASREEAVRERPVETPEGVSGEVQPDRGKRAYEAPWGVVTPPKLKEGP